MEIHVKHLLDSYYNVVGEQLITRESIEQDYLNIEKSDFVVVSHGTEVDPILNYGNQKALALWETDWNTFIQTPSSKTAEAIHRDERKKMLQEAEKEGYINNYNGIRISITGKRFYIQGALVWNVFDVNGNNIGQAATFSSISYL